MNYHLNKLAAEINVLLAPLGVGLEIERLPKERKVALIMYKLIFHEEKPRAMAHRRTVDEDQITEALTLVKP